MVGGIIPLRRATSSRYDGRFKQESAFRWQESRALKLFLGAIAPISKQWKVPPIEAASSSWDVMHLLQPLSGKTNVGVGEIISIQIIDVHLRLGSKPKLTGHQRKEAIARRQADEMLTDIARTYNVSHSTISRLH